MHDFAHELLLSLTIGGEVFAIAALWPLSDWAVTAPRRWAWVVALGAIGACVALDTHGLAFPALREGTWRWAIAHALQWTTLPLFIAFPDAVCVASAQSLTRAGVTPRRARAAALFVAVLAVAVAPFATMVAGCGPGATCS